MVAAVWVTTTSATTAARGARFSSVDHDSPVSPKWGAPLCTVPSTATPWACSPNAATSAVEPTMPISAPGMRRSSRAQTSMHRQHAEADGHGPAVDLAEVGEHVAEAV